MRFLPVNFRAPLGEYEQQAELLLDSHAIGDPDSIDIIHRNHPRFLDAEVRWLPLRLSDEEIRAAAFDRTDAQLTIARWYCFLDWHSLAAYVEVVTQENSPSAGFEAAAEAVITGDVSTLKTLIASDPTLVWARSERVTKFDPPQHRATLLHYSAANGVEQQRQKSPSNAVEIARELLCAGAKVDALAYMYGATATPMAMLVSSSPPFQAGVQIPLIDALADYGADVQAPLYIALQNGCPDAAEALLRRGARVETLELAAGLGRLPQAEKLLSSSAPDNRHKALSLAAQYGHVAIVEMPLNAGEDPNRFNPPGTHPHSTPLHQAALGGHADVVRLLVQRGAALDVEDKFFLSTPRGWAIHAGHAAVAELL